MGFFKRVKYIRIGKQIKLDIDCENICLDIWITQICIGIKKDGNK